MGLFGGCGSGGAGSQLRMALSASSVSGSLSPFVACPSHVCLGGCVPGIVEDDAVDLGLALGLVLEVEEEEEERGLVLLREVVLMSSGFVLRSNRLCSRVSDLGVALARVLAKVRVRLVVVGESPAVGRFVLVCLLAFEALEGAPVPLVLVEVQVRLVVVGVSLAVGRAVLVAGLLVFGALGGVLVLRVLLARGELSIRGFFALALVVVPRIRKRIRIVWSGGVLVLLSAAFCCSCFRAAPPRRLVPCRTQFSASRSWP